MQGTGRKSGQSIKLDCKFLDGWFYLLENWCILCTENWKKSVSINQSHSTQQNKTSNTQQLSSLPISLLCILIIVRSCDMLTDLTYHYFVHSFGNAVVNNSDIQWIPMRKKEYLSTSKGTK